MTKDMTTNMTKDMADSTSAPDNTPPSWPATPSARRKARRFAVQALYQWQIAGGTAREIEAYYCTANDMRKTDVNYFSEVLHAVITEHRALDVLYGPFLDRAIKDLDPIERAILRIGSYELQHHLDIPVRVVINEAIELTREFGATDDSHKYINGVLDKVARRQRAAEIAARQGAAE